MFKKERSMKRTKKRSGCILENPRDKKPKYKLMPILIDRKSGRRR